MVLESILNPTQAKRHPWEMIFIGALYTSIAMILGLMVFGSDASLVIVFLSVLACVPIMYGTMKTEENKDMVLGSESKMLKEHARTLLFFIYLFVGATLSFALWYIFLPPDISASAFSVQQRIITSINSPATGNFYDELSMVSGIFLNNIRVTLFCLLFAFLYGVGAIFILIWNASVLGAAIGDFVRLQISSIATATGHVGIAGHFYAMSLGVLRYFIHGIPEILAYFVAGLAGGIISIAIVRHDFQSKQFAKVLTDSIDLIAISIFILFIAALLEVFVTPAFF